MFVFLRRNCYLSVMCTYHVRIDDAVLEQVKPHFSGDAAMQSWIEGVLHHALLDYVAQLGELPISHSEHVFQQVKALESDPDGLLKLGNILKPSKLSAEELRDGYISEKYGV